MAFISTDDGQFAFQSIRKAISLHSPFRTSAQCSPSKLPQTSRERINAIEEKTILYLAYGSNLSRETFTGNRGIIPISALNVHVPSLDLTFDLAGIPYTEPCFASSAQRDVDLVPDNPETTKYKQRDWQKGMIGVVYEVTPEDYKTIIATEGGGASYQDIIVDCYPIDAGLKTVPNSHRDGPVKAHTLLTLPGGQMSRPDPTYAQASARYLKLITDGAEEHALPAEYIAYLYSLQPYTITTNRQEMGKTLFAGLWMPIILAMFTLSRGLVDEEGRIPVWLAKVHAIVFYLLWMSYDVVFKRVFGDGERTIESGDEESGRKLIGEKIGLDYQGWYEK
jgi:hypothetical protein